MAAVLQLANLDRTTTVDLLGGTFKLVDKSWQTQGSPPNLTYSHTPYGANPTFNYYDVVTETMTLAGQGTVAQLMSGIYKIETVLENARQYHRGGNLYGTSWWLEWNADGESAKRSLLYSGTLQYPPAVGWSAMIEDGVLVARLAITRHPAWETITPVRVTTNAVSALGGKVAFQNPTGTLPSRIGQIRIAGNTGGSGNGMDKIWIGVRPGYTSSGSYNPVWELEHSYSLGDDTTKVYTTAASGNYALACTFAGTTTLAYRVKISVANVCAGYGNTNYTHYQGRYLVLLRAKVSSGSGTVGIQMRSGYTGNIVANEVYLESTAYTLLELGTVQIPPWTGSRFASDAYCARFRIDLYAERVSGTAQAYFDCLVLVPCEHLAVLEGCNVESTLGYDAYLEMMENDTPFAYEYGPAQIQDDLTMALTDWYLPNESSGVFVVAGEGSTNQELGVTVNVTTVHYPRWLTYRDDTSGASDGSLPS